MAFAGLLLGTVAAGATPPAPPPVSVSSAAASLAAGAGTVVPVAVRVAALPLTADVMVLLDVSTSMTLTLDTLRPQLAVAVTRLAADGVDLRVGLALAGTAPRPQGGQPDPRAADPVVDPANPAYRPPALFRRVLPVSPVPAFLTALAAVRPEVLVSTSDTALVFDRAQAQLLGTDQLLTGTGSPGSDEDNHLDAVPAGQVAGWRDGAARLIVSATDHELDAPYGTRDVADVGPVLVAQRVAHVGLVALGYAPGVTDLARISAASGTYVPAGGLRCGGFDGTDMVPGGAPFVCNPARAALAVETAVHGLRRAVPLTVTSSSTDGVLRGLTGARATLDGTARTVDVGVSVACPAAATASRHPLPLTASYGGATASGVVTVLCAALPAAVPGVAAVPPVAPAAADPVPPVQPPPPPPPAPAPAPAPGANAQQANAAQLQPGLRPQDDTSLEVAEERTDDDPAALLLGAAALTAAAALTVARRTALAAVYAGPRRRTR